MRVTIEHTTGFHYDTPARSSYNEARMTPLTTSAQSVWSTRLWVEPTPWQFTYTDYWGTSVTAFEVHEPHDTLTVRAQSVIDTYPHRDNKALDDFSWATLRSDPIRDQMGEFLARTARTEPHPELAAAVEELRGRSPREAAVEACRLVHEHIAYTAGVTQVASTATQVWSGAKGVCQDYCHTALGALGALGIPARYVSGYLHPFADAGPGETVSAESHSWLEFWCGTWVGFDPTSFTPVGERHVRVGHGRDYADVSPLRGTYAGGDSEMFVRVRMTQLG